MDFRVTHDSTVIDLEVAHKIAFQEITRADTQRLKNLSFQDMMEDAMSHSMQVRIYFFFFLL